MSSAGPDHAILYDRDCGFCRWSLDKILARDRGARLRPVEIQGAEGQRLLGHVPAERRLDSWHLVTPEGATLSAGAAAAPLAGLLPGGRIPAALLRAFPRLTDRAYRAVAANRAGIARLLRIDASCEVRRS